MWLQMQARIRSYCMSLKPKWLQYFLNMVQVNGLWYPVQVILMIYNPQQPG